jgi:hypothetical protein
MPSPRFTRPIRTAIGLAVLVGATLAISGGSVTASPKSQPINGQMLRISNVPCGSATGVCSTFTSTGALAGEGLVSVDTFPTADGISKAHTVITTRSGELHCHEAAIFDLVGEDHAFVDLCVIDGGTGHYDGASGYIQEVGTFDFASNLGEARYTGKLILP